MKKITWLNLLLQRFTSPPIKRKRASRHSETELLEDRTLLSSLTLSGGNLTFTSSAAVANNLTVSYNAGLTEYTFSDPNETITTAIPGAVGSGTNSVTFPAAGVTTSMVLNMGNLDDSANIASFNSNGTGLKIYGQGGSDTATIGGNVTGMAGTFGELDVEQTNLNASFNAVAQPAIIRGAVTLGGTASIVGNLVLVSGNIISDGTPRDLTVTGSNIMLNGNLGVGNSLGNLVVNGTTNFQGIEASSVTITSASAIRLFQNVTASTGAVTLNGPVDIRNDLVITTGLGAGDNFTATGNVTGPAFQSLTVNAGLGDAIYGGNVQTINQFDSTAANNTFNSILARNVDIDGNASTTGIVTATVGGISIDGNYNYAGNTSLVAANNQTIEVTGTTTGAGGNLLVSASSGNLLLASFSGAVSGVNELTMVTNTALTATFVSTISANSVNVTAGTINLGGNVTALVDGVTLTGIVTLTGSSVITSSGVMGDNITIMGTLTSAPATNFSATLNAGSGNVNVTGAIGAQPLGSLTVSGNSLMLQAATVLNNINLNADVLSIGGPLSGAGRLNVTSQTVGLGITVNGSAGGTLSLTPAILANFANGFNRVVIGVATSGNVSVVGLTTFNDTVEINSGGTISVNGGIQGGGSIGEGVLLNGNTQLTGNISTNGGVIFVTGNLNLTGTSSLTTNGMGGASRVRVTGDLNGAGSLTVNNGSVNNLFEVFGNIGNTTALDQLTVTSSVDFRGTVSANNVSVTGTINKFANNVSALTGGVVITGGLFLTGNSIITTGGLAGDDFSVSGQTQSQGGPFSLTVNAADGDVTFMGPVGGLTSFSATGENVTVSAVTTNSVDISGTNVNLASNVRALTGDVNITGDVTLNGGNTQITASSGSDITITGDVDATAGQNLTVLGNGGALNSANFTGTIDGIGKLDVRGTTVDFQGIIGGGTAVNELFVISGDATIGSDITVNGNFYWQTTAGDLTNNAAVLSNNGNITTVTAGVTDGAGTFTAPNGVVSVS